MKTAADIASTLNLDPEWFALNDDRASIEQELVRIAKDAIEADRVELKSALERSDAVPGFRAHPLATADALIDAYDVFTGPDISVFIDAWNNFTAGIDFPCPENPTGLHQVTDGSCNLCGDKNRA